MPSPQGPLGQHPSEGPRAGENGMASAPDGAGDQRTRGKSSGRPGVSLSLPYGGTERGGLRIEALRLVAHFQPALLVPRGGRCQPRLAQSRQLPTPLSAPHGGVMGYVEGAVGEGSGGPLGSLRLLLRPALSSALPQGIPVSLLIASLPSCLRRSEGRVIGVGFTPAAVPLAGLGRPFIGQFTS
jgi:hypothetical protein